MTRDDYHLYLDGIELGARQALRNARLLPRRPDFKASAEYELALARKVLGEALQDIVEAQAAYQSKPVVP